jgi:hypothetical protein
MTITLEFSEKQVQQLRARARAHGQSLEQYLMHLAEEASGRDAWSKQLRALPGLLPKDKLRLPDEALRRETMYRE